MPRDAVSRTANVERTGRHKWVKSFRLWVSAQGSTLLFLAKSNEIQYGLKLKLKVWTQVCYFPFLERYRNVYLWAADDKHIICILSDLTHLCLPVRSTFAVRETASLGIMGPPRVPPLNPSELIVLSCDAWCDGKNRNSGAKRTSVIALCIQLFGQMPNRVDN